MNAKYENAADSSNVKKPNALIRRGPNAQTPGAMTYPPSLTATQTRTTSPTPRAAKKSTRSASNCTPSPTRSMAPSASRSSFPAQPPDDPLTESLLLAWTTCPYISKDGDRNPDVDDIPDATALNEMPLGVLYNAIAFALVNGAGPAGTAGMDAAPSDVYAQTAAKFIDTWFLNSATAMNSNLQYGQLIRGPGKQVGQFMGILDARGFVSVWNSVAILKTLRSSTWTAQRDSAMVAWAKQYMNWLVSSELGQKAAGSPKYVIPYTLSPLIDFAFQQPRHFLDGSSCRP